MSELAEKRKELKRLEQQAIVEAQQLALVTAKSATSTEIMSKLAGIISEMLEKRVTNVELCNNDYFLFTMNNSLQGGRHDQGTVAKITLVTGDCIEWTFDQRGSSMLWLYHTGDSEKRNQLSGAMASSGWYKSDIGKARRIHNLTTLLGKNGLVAYADEHFVAFMGLFMGALDSFLAQYARSMRQCQCDRAIPIDSDNMSNLWGSIFKHTN